MASFLGEDVISSASSISISSLLASCSLGSSGKHSQSLSSSIQYNDRLYDSASKALEAYIADYEEGLSSPAASTGKIYIDTHAIRKNCTSKRPFRQKVSSISGGKHTTFSSFSTRRVVSDPDLVSLTTDDLLGFASDGSLPTDKRFMLECERRKPTKWKGRSYVKKAIRSTQRASSLDRYTKDVLHGASITDGINLTQKNPKKKHLLGSKNVSQTDWLDHTPSLSLSRDLQYKVDSSPSSSKQYPRWLTSQKSDLNVSGITSISDSKYPIWLKNYNLLPDSGSLSLSPTDKKSDQSLFTQRRLSSDSPFLDCMDNSGRPIHENGNTLDPEGDPKGLLRFNQSASPFDTEYFPLHGASVSNQTRKPFKDDQIELLILKAERTLESSNRAYSAPDRSPLTEDILEADRSWEKIPITFKSPVPVYCEEDGRMFDTKKSTLENDILKDRLNDESTLSGGNHHGPVEALKQMLFNLQTVQQSLVDDLSADENQDLKQVGAENTSESKLFDQEMMPVNNSLQKALHHLSRLKELVEESGVKQSQESVHTEEQN